MIKKLSDHMGEMFPGYRLEYTNCYNVVVDNMRLVVSLVHYGMGDGKRLRVWFRDCNGDIHKREITVSFTNNGFEFDQAKFIAKAQEVAAIKRGNVARRAKLERQNAEQYQKRVYFQNQLARIKADLGIRGYTAYATYKGVKIDTDALSPAVAREVIKVLSQLDF